MNIVFLAIIGLLILSNSFTVWVLVRNMMKLSVIKHSHTTEEAQVLWDGIGEEKKKKWEKSDESPDAVPLSSALSSQEVVNKTYELIRNKMAQQ